MPSLQDMCVATRILCDEPRSQRPSAHRILMAVTQKTQSFYSKLENTGQAWSLKPDYLLNVSANTGDFLLAVDDSYGKPVQVITTYPSNPSFIPRYVEFREFSYMNFDWPFPKNMASWIMNDGSNCTAMRIAFYYQDDGSRWARVLPQPQLNATYAITFASGDWASTAAMESSPVLTQFHQLIETWAAQSILPSCQWEDDQKYNMEHRKELFFALKNDEAEMQDDFQRYCRNLVVDQIGIRDSSMDGDSFRGWS